MFYDLASGMINDLDAFLWRLVRDIKIDMEGRGWGVWDGGIRHKDANDNGLGVGDSVVDGVDDSLYDVQQEKV